MTRLPNHIYYQHIEPYTRRPQPKILLEDIVSFHATLEEIKAYYTKLMYYRHSKDDLGLYTEHMSFYHEFLIGLCILLGLNHIDFCSYKMLEMDVRVCRLLWGSSSPDDRIEIIIHLKSLTQSYFRRPGDV